MTRLLIPVSCLLWLACAAPSNLPAGLMEGSGDARGVGGLERLEGTGAFLPGTLEQFRVHLDRAVVERVSWSASAGALRVSGDDVSWSLPDVATAELMASVVHRDGTSGTKTWQLALQRNTTLSAQEALLATPMPILDGGSLEVSGGGCDVQYEGTTSNVAIAFTSQTHPSLSYGRWNGTAWTLEVVDALGFNTGGDVSPFVQMKLASDGTPHILYLRNSQVFYATKSGGTWLRERVDSVAFPLYVQLPTIVLGTNGSPLVGYTSFSSGYYRPMIASRTGPNTWTQTVPFPATGLMSTASYYVAGEALLDGQSRFVVPIYGNNNSAYLLSWNGTTAEVARSPYVFAAGYAAAALASPTRALWRGPDTIIDATLTTTFTATTMTASIIETTTTSGAGDIVWAQGKPVVLHQHGSSLELVTPNANGFWTYSQLGSSSGVVAAMAVQSGSSTVSICYQANSRIMFQ